MAALGLSPDPDRLLTVERLGELLPTLDIRLGGLAAPVDVLVVGGAAIAMQWNPRRPTYDVDVVDTVLPQAFWDAVADVAEAEGLGAHWLNNAAKVAVPTGTVPGSPSLLYEGSNLRVHGASAHLVLVMKLRAGRDVDIDDMPALLEVVRPRSPGELYDLFEQAYPHHPVPASTRRVIDEEVWPAYVAAHPEIVVGADAGQRDHRVYLSVQPAANLTAGWDVTIRAAEGLALRTSGLYSTKEDAAATARFAADIVDSYYPLAFAGSPQTRGPPPVDAVRVSVAAGVEHRLVAAAPTGDLVAYSDPHTAVGAYNALAFVEALSGLVGDPAGRLRLRVTVDEDCACRYLDKGPCRHHAPHDQQVPPRSREASARNPAAGVVATTEPDAPLSTLGDAATLGVHVRPYPLDDHGWEVTTTEPDGTPRRLSGLHPTLEEAEQARDFMVQLVNTHPQLHILGSDPPRDQVPTVGLYSHRQGGPWYVQTRTPDGTVHAASPPYATRKAAAAALNQLGLLSAATAHREIGQRATVEPTSTSCRCSWRGWRCGHIEIEPPEVDPPERGHGLSL